MKALHYLLLTTLLGLALASDEQKDLKLTQGGNELDSLQDEVDKVGEEVEDVAEECTSGNCALKAEMGITTK